jgi:hypothetical protein
VRVFKQKLIFNIMEKSHLALLIPIFTTLGFFLLVFGIVYLRNREKMAMIERGMDPRLQIDKPGTQSYVLTAAMLFIGCGTGLFLAFIVDEGMLSQYTNSFPVYCSMIALFGGLGLLTAYLVEKKQMGNGK